MDNQPEHKVSKRGRVGEGRPTDEEASLLDFEVVSICNAICPLIVTFPRRQKPVDRPCSA